MIRIRRVSGNSMLPALRPGQIVVAIAKRVEKGSVVIASLPDHEVIKRVKSISAKGIELEGDNQEFSTDSRQYGAVDPRSIRGVVVWPRTPS